MVAELASGAEAEGLDFFYPDHVFSSEADSETFSSSVPCCDCDPFFGAHNSDCGTAFDDYHDWGFVIYATFCPSFCRRVCRPSLISVSAPHGCSFLITINPNNFTLFPNTLQF